MNKSLILFLTGSLLLSACSKKSDSTTTSASTNIVGTWLSTSEHNKIYTPNGALALDTTYTTVSEYMITFDQSGGYEVRDGSTSHLLTNYGTYSTSGNNLSMIQEGNTTADKSTILEINSTTLGIEDTFQQTADSSTPTLNPSVTYKYVEDSYFVKQ